MRFPTGSILALALLIPVGCSAPYHGAGHGMSMEKGLGEVKAIIAKNVKDQDKAAKAQALLDEIVAEVKAVREENRKLHGRLYELNADYNAPPEDFTKVLDELSNSRMRSATKILGLRFKMKELMTAEEWKAVNDGMNEYRGNYQRKEAGGDARGGY